MRDPVVFEYTVVRVVPRVERGEFVNAGVILYCQDRRFLEARIDLDAQRLRAVDPDADVEAITSALEGFVAPCAGAGPAGATSLGERFRWLAAPRSTIVQTGPAHSGLTTDPAAELERLLDRLVR